MTDIMEINSLDCIVKKGQLFMTMHRSVFSCMITRDSLIYFELILRKDPDLIWKRGFTLTITNLPREDCLH
jgi:hypothetical protein